MDSCRIWRRWRHCNSRLVQLDVTASSSNPVAQPPRIKTKRFLEDDKTVLKRTVLTDGNALEFILDLLPSPTLLLELLSGRVKFANRAAHKMAGGKFPMDIPSWRSPLASGICSRGSPT